MPDAPSAPRPCPACDYDLRASTTGRCPECGTLIGLGPLSNVPWVYRHHRGERRAYLETLWLLIRHPARLAEEVAHRVNIRHARRFHHESILLATILTTGCLTLAFLMRGPTVEQLLSPPSRLIAFFRPTTLPVTPAFVLADSMAMLVPLFISVFLSLHASMAVYRIFFAVGGGRSPGAARVRRRARILAYYASGITPLVGLFVGGTFALLIARFDMTFPANSFWRLVIPAGLLVLPPAGLWTFYYPTVMLLRRAGRAGALRVFTMGYLFPLLQPALWMIVSTPIFWLAGYLSIVIWSSAN